MVNMDFKMKRYLFFLLVILFLAFGNSAYAQNGQPAFPAALDTDCTQFQVTDGATAKLKLSLSSTATTIVISDTSAFPSCGMIWIDGREKAYYTSKTSSSLNGVTRGREGTAALVHAAGVVVSLPLS